ncbi:MAG: hypothetical protein DA408_10630 [Bacteroidetes bacterium]|nr:MAG: hypothetical protein C7N36_11450 [Bacteroidota bacterium]PTM12409.1 MAG: hypothetical protein DA408_10630 [Bacteroidota bacterium]
MDQVSFFIALQVPESGGELVVYSLPWQEDQTKLTSSGSLSVFSKTSKTAVHLEQAPEVHKIVLKPMPGDMILFQGGQLWHRVATVEGAKDRITFGDFLGFFKDKNKIAYWS